MTGGHNGNTFGRKEGDGECKRQDEAHAPNNKRKKRQPESGCNSVYSEHDEYGGQNEQPGGANQPFASLLVSKDGKRNKDKPNPSRGVTQ